MTNKKILLIFTSFPHANCMKYSRLYQRCKKYITDDYLNMVYFWKTYDILLLVLVHNEHCCNFALFVCHTFSHIRLSVSVFVCAVN